VSVDGGPLQKVADVVSGAYLGGAWAPDGTFVFSAGTRLFRVPVTGGTPEALTPDPGPNPSRVLTAPVLLPGSSAVLFGVVEDGADTVSVLDLTSGDQKVLVEGAQNPNYLPSGHLVFARGTTLMAAPFDLDELALTGLPVTQPENVRDPGASTAADYAVSATGTLVYVPDTQEDARDTLVWVDNSGRSLGRAVVENLSAPRNPRVSPDGTRIAVTTGRQGDGELWIHDLRGRPPIPLALVDDNRGSVWSPDGTRVAFSGLRGVFLDVFLTPADGSISAPAPVRPDRVLAWVMDWHANELLVVGFPRSSILAVDVTTGTSREIVATGDAEMDPDLSPDGRWLAYASDRTGRFEIWLKRHPDGVALRVSANGGYEPRWSVTGRELFYLQGNTLMAVAVDEGPEFSFRAPVDLFTAPYATFPEPSITSYDVAPDGRFLMIERQDSSADSANESGFVVVQNWMEELERRMPASR
jgi:serine/threonine-protein kinase